MQGDKLVSDSARSGAERQHKICEQDILHAAAGYPAGCAAALVRWLLRMLQTMAVPIAGLLWLVPNFRPIYHQDRAKTGI